MSKILAAALLASTALPAAALTAPEVWEDWQTAYATIGISMEPEARSYEDGVLRLTDLTMTTRQEMFGETVVTTSRYIGEHVFTERDDGTVRYVPPATMAVSDTTEGMGDPTVTTYTITMEEAEVIARDEPDGARIYDFDIGRFGYAFDDVTGGEAATPSVGMTIAAEGYEGRHRTAPDGRAFTMDATMASATIDMDAPDAPEPFAADLSWTDLTSTFEGRFPATPPEEGGAMTLAALAELDFAGDLTHGGGTLSVEAEGPQGPVSIESASEAGSLDVAMSPDGIEYGIGSEAASVTATLPQFPVPVSMGYAASETGVSVPIRPSEAAPWSMDVALRDLTVDDAIWSLFDPTGQLPRDPATLLLSLQGEAEVTADVFGDPAALESGAPPFRPLTANVTEMLLRVAGAQLGASGALTFPEPDALSEPVGSIDLTLDGAFGLLDSIVALGFVPPEQATFARAMLGGLAEEVGEDSYALTLQFTPGGGVNANGMPLR